MIESLLDGKWIGAFVLATGVSLGIGLDASAFLELPESAWTSRADRPIECQDPSTAPTATPGHSNISSERTFTMEKFANDGSRLARYTDLAAGDPESAVKAVLYDVERRMLSAAKAADWLFSRLVTSRSIDGAPYFDALRLIARPEQVAEIALNQYRSLGNERRLAIAASLLREYGASAWPALCWIAKTGFSDSEYFVDLVASIRGVRHSQKTEVLAELASIGNADVKWGIVAALENHPELRRPVIFAALTADADSEILEAAALMAKLPG